MRFGIIGSGSWATALAKILTDNKLFIHWLVRTEEMAAHMRSRHHNPNYLSSAYFDNSLLSLSTDINEVVENSDHIIVAVPSAYLKDTLEPLRRDALKGRKVISAVKGMLPENNLLLNDHLAFEFDFDLHDYVTIMGPCHAEEVSSEKLSYLTFSAHDIELARKIALSFSNEYINTIVNNDVIGVQYAAILKNIYALAAGIAHGLDYGDNFLSVLIANCADEMAGFLRKVGIPNIEVGRHDGEDVITHQRNPNYAASVYLGDLLVTCYSLFSRNRTFGNMIGKGYSVRSTMLEMNMVAEGYYASKCINALNTTLNAEMPIATAVYNILWNHVKPAVAFRQVEECLI